MLETKKKEINIFEYWQIFLRRKYFFIIPFVFCLIVGIILALIANPVYECSTVLQISESPLLTDNVRSMTPGVMVQEKYDNLNRLITSYKYLKRVIKTLNLENDPDMQTKAREKKDKYPELSLVEVTELLWIDKLRNLLEIVPIGENFIKLITEANSPELVFNITQALTKIFIDESLQHEVGGIKGAIEFSSEQLALYKERLQESEARLQRFKENLVQDQFEDNSFIVSNQDQTNRMLTSIEFELQDAKDRLNFLHNRINELALFYYPPRSSQLNELKSRLLEATLQMSKMMLKYSWQDPEVIKINLVIDELREKIRTEIERDVKSQYSVDDGSNLDLIVQKETIAMNIEFLERKKIELNRLIQIFRASLAKAPARELNLNRLEREVEVNRQIYSAFLEQARGSEIEKAVQKTSAKFRFKIVEPAIKPIEPIKPKRHRMVIMAVVVGFFLGFGMISLLELQDHSFRNVEEVEKCLNLPVLGTMPRIEMGISKKKW